MRFRSTIPVLVTLIFTMVVLPASAQRLTPVPNTGMDAIGGWMGFSAPADPSLTQGLDLAGTVEHYVTPRTSIRGEVGGTWWKTTGRGFQADLTPVFLNGNVVYNWEGGVWHPYVTAGAGLYHYAFSAPPVQFSENKPGMNIGGGIEYFLSRRATFVGDLRYHAVPDIHPLGPFQSSFWRVSAGLKRYF
jgi:Outer membrane protein beta-barrel domain